MPWAVCSLQERCPHPVTWVFWQLRPLPGLPQHPYGWTLICLAESVCLWGCNLSRSHPALGEGSRFEGSSWIKPFPRGLGDREGALLPWWVAWGRQSQWPRPSPPGRANNSSSHFPAPAEVLPGCLPPCSLEGPSRTCSPACCDPATFSDTTWCPALAGSQENRHPGHSWEWSREQARLL